MDVQEAVVVQTVQIIQQVVDAQAVLRAVLRVARQPAKEVVLMGVTLYVVVSVDIHAVELAHMYQPGIVVHRQLALPLVQVIVTEHVQWLVVQVASHNAFMDLSNLNTL